MVIKVLGETLRLGGKEIKKESHGIHNLVFSL